jgi:hypothetical protein
MLCPGCRRERCGRSKRHGAKDYVIGATGLRPWRCRGCGLRFYAWSVALPFLLDAHCSKCGNFDLQRISRQHVEGWSAWFFRWVRVSAYRCAPCRYRFFSIRPAGRIRCEDAETEPQAASPGESSVASG